jgi:hypothetical protein
VYVLGTRKKVLGGNHSDALISINNNLEHTPKGQSMGDMAIALMEQDVQLERQDVVL